MISGAMNAGFQGIQTGMRGMQASAERITQATTTNVTQPQAVQQGLSQAGGLDDITSAVVDLKLYEVQASASAKVVKTADNVLGTLLDTMA
ncbi:flagellar biosynthesis protein FlgE [Allohahella sp. A8]|uniref:flagellar biosynthesis protein FlgE n=1 Tax=Allohahella sp. A8 TaxID=3141461 RepID=UPI000C098EEC|nr:flagellar biosynthesis protein FlgE [Hahellaceae bacterium]|tara:strand:+ start:101592 stop:101864 length:273 start_codon:yes stop_codon:yes gene_type:complete